ncbi:MAG TPA: DUF1707 domain-containing protein [Pseudonocardia sp.]|jgi:hypothetical protein|uniref:DUF1707 SHOCT-like domain-containing protein n=1 Tax=Pseudonocardia sp. TaxID=60912 RepID=UPI002CF70BC4|nr:DUF1707 domain-containing protein [Pseudonocardia sp.]HTF47081.1 DUF1707 domain-containing protein [Pseudonocardia sp.]
MATEELRAADVDRERVAERLSRAHAEGRIDLVEFDERVAAAYAARTYAELTPLTADLPPEGARQSPPRSASAGLAPSGRASAGRASARPNGWAVARRIQLACWLFVGLLNVAIWAAVSIGVGGGVYPWWVWVIGPWGVVLVLEHLAARLWPGRPGVAHTTCASTRFGPAPQGHVH